MSQTIDPVASPEAYRASLLAALGADDPAVAQAETPAAIRAHIFDGELVVSARVRWILAEDEPDIVGYDQALWVAELRHNEDDPALLLATFEALRAANLDLWARRTVADRERVGRHRERGPESYDMTFRLAAGHDRIHLAQARRALDEVAGRS